MKHLLIIISLMVILASCQREPVEIIEYEPPIINQPMDEVNGTIVGIVTSEGNAISGAVIGVHGEETMTDHNGKFSLENVKLYADGTYITVFKPGYFHGSRKIYAIQDEINVAAIEMIRNDNPTNFNPSAPKVFEAAYTTLTLPSGDYMLSANEAYVGEINVGLESIPLGSENSTFKMPGDLTGVDSNLDLRAISNFGIFNLDITSQSREQLLLPLSSSCTFELIIPEQESYDEGGDLLLWHFDENNGTWIESGEATFVNGTYFGEIDKGGYWMVGLAYDYADLGGILVDPSSSFGDTRLDIKNTSKGFSSTLFTTMSGKYLSRVPQDVDLDMVIFHECTVGRQNEEIGVIHTDKQLEPITIEVVMDNIEILGKITDCNGSDSARPYLKVDFGDEQYMYRSDDQGNFDFAFTNCSGENVSIIAIDDETSQTSEALSLPVHNLIDVGNIQTCNEIATGYEIDYTNMNWKTNLDSTIIHEWVVSRVSAIENKIIFSAKMIDQVTGELFLKAAFVFVEGASEAEYQLNFKTQGFIINGICNLVQTDHDGISSFRFEGGDEDIGLTGEGTFPDIVDVVNFNLVYYD